MKSLPRPTGDDARPLAAGDLFDTCISRVRDAALKAALRAVRPIVVREAADYDAKAVVEDLYLKPPQTAVGPVSRDEMVKVYTFRMARKPSPGRSTYDRILSAPQFSRCPLCGIGTVTSLDHYLPKTQFPVHSVTPNNLVPCCGWCQDKKGDYYSRTKEDQLLHPYFDEIDNELWLSAEVVAAVPAGFRFFVSPVPNWAAFKRGRVTAHVRALRLGELYAANAGSRLSEIRGRLASLYQGGGGKDAVRAHLLEELTSIETEYRNSWVAAMYRAAVSSDWFCDGGFQPT